MKIDSVNKSSQNTLSKSFERQAVKLVEDREYSASDFDNAEFFVVPHNDSIARLNNTVKRLRDGNAQIFYTMLYKDLPRKPLIAKLWNAVVSSKEFQELPEELKALELEQAKKLGPKSRFSEEKLWQDFIGHIDASRKQVNRRFSDYQDAADAVCEYWTILGKKALKEDPSLYRYIDIDQINARLRGSMPNDKSGGYSYYSNVDDEIAGVKANDLYYEAYLKWKRKQHTEMLFEEFCRVQAKGNTLFEGMEGYSPISPRVEDIEDASEWLDEKNRCVQGDSRSMQFPYKPISDVLTKIVKEKDANLLGWKSFEERSYYMHNMFKEFYGKFQFESFDASGYDWSTDPRNQQEGIRVMFKLARNLGLNTDYFINEKIAIRHYSYDPTVTTRGIFDRAGSTPSGANLTGPNGTVQNYIRCWLQTADLFHMTPHELIPVMLEYNERDIPLFSCVGDDAWAMRDLLWGPKQMAEDNLLLGFDNNEAKIVASTRYIHYLQLGYYYDGESEYLSYGSVMRCAENLLFQETANEHASSLDMTGSAMQQLTNTRYSPLQPILVDFAMEGDPKWRLGGRDPAGFIKEAAKGRTPAEFFHREWDPTYADMTWENYAEANRATYQEISRASEKYPPALGDME